jgi:phosphopantetheinyl transferase
VPLPARRALWFYILWSLEDAFTKALGEPLARDGAQCALTEESDAWPSRAPTANAWIARVFQLRSQLALRAVALPPCSANAVNPSVFAHERPDGNVSTWMTLASLSSDTSLAE